MSTTSGQRSSGIPFQRIYRLDILIVSLTIHFLALALTMQRPYKEPWSVDKAMEYIGNSDGHFEPRLAELFASIRDEIESIRDFWNQHEKDELFTASVLSTQS